MLDQTTLQQGMLNYTFLVAAIPIVLIGDLKFMPALRDRLKSLYQIPQGQNLLSLVFPLITLTLGQVTGCLCFLRTLRWVSALHLCPTMPGLPTHTAF